MRRLLPCRRIARLSLVFLSFAAFILLGCEEPKTLRHVDIVLDNPDFYAVVEGFQEQLAALGYVEEKTIRYRVKSLAAETVLDPLGSGGSMTLSPEAEVVLTLLTEASLRCRELIRGTTASQVFAYAGIEESELITSIREPGGRITGVRYPGPEQISKRLEILHEIAPHLRRIYIGYNPEYPNNPPALAVLRQLAKEQDIVLVEVPLQSARDLQDDLTARDRRGNPGVDAILLMPDTLNHSHDGWQLLLSFANRHRLPVAGSFLYTVEQGALFGNANDLKQIGRLAAPLAHKIFQGIAAGTIPVVTPEQDLYINVKRARELGLYVPEGLLRQAQEIIR